jgi:hypothetical protein
MRWGTVVDGVVVVVRWRLGVVVLGGRILG